MSNNFWNFTALFTAGTLAKAEDVNSNLSGVAAGLDLVEAELNKAIQSTAADGTMDITENAASRANKIVQFDSSGDVELGTVIGNWQGNHDDPGGGTIYYVRDVVKDAAARIGLNNIYICNTEHTSTGNILTDTANWDLVIDVTDAVTAKDAAETAQAAAELAEDNAGDSETNAAASAAELQGATALTYNATTAFDFDGNQTQTMATVTGNLTTLTTSNRADGKSFTVLLIASGGARTITYNASWRQIGYLPTSIPSGKALLLTFVCAGGTAETNVFVAGALEP